MSLRSTLGAALYVPLTLVLAPGILTHEYAHVAACRLSGVAVHSTPSLNPFGKDAYVDHAPTDRFAADFAIAVAPFAVNSALAVPAFVVAGAVESALAVPFLWLGGCFAWTAIPSPSDTDGLLETAGGLPWTTRPLGYLLAVPVRAATLLAIEGIGSLVWTVALYVAIVG
ncbi:zinc metalloprotease [Halostella litorea]|uniref:hypothetical protein n=1 Tax=Halostella litorea TaxID=2528831 RepID=UPI00109247CC|nr:hypothetical protein [Halostella litorea]